MDAHVRLFLMRWLHTRCASEADGVVHFRLYTRSASGHGCIFLDRVCCRHAVNQISEMFHPLHPPRDFGVDRCGGLPHHPFAVGYIRCRRVWYLDPPRHECGDVLPPVECQGSRFVLPKIAVICSERLFLAQQSRLLAPATLIAPSARHTRVIDDLISEDRRLSGTRPDQDRLIIGL